MDRPEIELLTRDHQSQVAASRLPGLYLADILYDPGEHVRFSPSARAPATAPLKRLLRRVAADAAANRHPLVAFRRARIPARLRAVRAAASRPARARRGRAAAGRHRAA